MNSFMPNSFSDRIPAGAKRKYDLIIDSEDTFRIKGLAYSDDPRIHLETRAFMGRRCHVVAPRSADTLPCFSAELVVAAFGVGLRDILGYSESTLLRMSNHPLSRM